MNRRHAFTLIELLVVISIIALLIGILLPVLGNARETAKTMQCLSNIRNMQIAHWMYMVDNDGYFIQANLAHGGIIHYDADGNPIVPWIETLQDYYESELHVRSPVDDSPHWGPYPAGIQIPSAPTMQRRVTSYGINDYLVDLGSGSPTLRLEQIAKPTDIVHFLIMGFEGTFAGADHPHVYLWDSAFPPFLLASSIADEQVEIDAHGGPPESPESKSNWGFLDGHAKTAAFREVYISPGNNRFNPELNF